MANGYYTHSTYPATNAQGSSSGMRAELDAVMAGFALLPTPLGLGQQGFSGGTWNGGTVTNAAIDGSVIGAVARAAGSFTALAASGLATLAGGGSLTGTFTALAGAILAAFAITGGSINAAPIGATTPSTASFTSLNVSGAATFTGPIITAGGFASSGGSLELGSQTASALAYVDFHSSGVVVDYDARIAASGGSATIGQGTLTYTALAHAFNVRPTFAGNVPWDLGNLPQPVSATGAQFTGPITMFSAGTLTPLLTFKAGTYAPTMRGNSGNSSIEFVNSANTTVNMGITDAGALTVRGGATFGSRPTWGGFTPWDSNNFTPTNYLAKAGDTASNSISVVLGGISDSYQGTLGGGFLKLNQVDYGGYVDFSRTRSQDYVWRIHYNFSTGNLEYIVNPAYNGNASNYVLMQPNSDIYCSQFGSVWTGILARVSIRSNAYGLGGFVGNTDGHIQERTWGGTYINAYVDGSYQGGLVTTALFGTNYNALINGSIGSIASSNAVGGMKTGSASGPNPNPGGGWAATGAGSNSVYLYVRVS